MSSYFYLVNLTLRYLSIKSGHTVSRLELLRLRQKIDAFVTFFGTKCQQGSSQSDQSYHNISLYLSGHSMVEAPVLNWGNTFSNDNNIKMG